MNPRLIWLLALLSTAPAGGLLPGDATFSVGPGSARVVRPAGLATPARWVDGSVRLPADGSAAAALALDTLPLAADTVHTLAMVAWAAEGSPVLQARVTAGSRLVAEAALPLAAEPRTYQLTFRTPPAAGEAALPLTVTLTPRSDAAGEAAIDSLALAPGAVAPEPARVPVAIGAVAGEALGGPLWRPGAALTVRALGPPGAVAGWAVAVDAAERPVQRWRLGPTRDNAWTLPLDALPPGAYRLDLRAEAGGMAAEASQPLVLLEPVIELAGPRLSFAAAAVPRADEAVALGLGAARLVRPWATLADAEGRADPVKLSELAAEIDALIAAGVEPTLVLGLTPAGALPPGVRTPRKMDSHGFAKGTPLPDTERFLAFAAALGERLGRRGLVYELDDAPYRTWHGNDYVEYLRRFRETLTLADPSARIAGGGFGFTSVGGGKPVAFLDEIVKRGAFELLDRLTVELPMALGEAPETAAEAGLSALLADLSAREGLPPLALVGEPAGNGPAADARWLRAWLLAQAARPAVFASGWRGETGAREAMLNAWLAHYAGAEWLGELPLGEGLRAVRYRLPDGREVLAAWDASDPRDSLAEPRDEVRLTLPLQQGAGVTVRDASGREGLDAGRPRWSLQALQLVVPLSFEPIYIEADAGAMPTMLARAVVRGAVRAPVATRLAVRGGLPGLLVEVGPAVGEALAGDVRLRSSGGIELLAERFSYLVNARERGEWFVPVVAWEPGAVARVRALVEAGGRLADRSETWAAWRPALEAALVIDGEPGDWPADAATFAAHTADHLTEPRADYLGPDDASLRLSALPTPTTLYFHAEVVDDALTEGDALELLLDLDLAGDADRARADADDYRVTFTAIADGQFQGRVKVAQAEPGPALLSGGDVHWRLRPRETGYAVEAALPLTDAGAAAVAASGGLGFEAVVVDVDEGQPPLRMMLYDSVAELEPQALAQVWIGREPGPVPSDFVGLHPPRPPHGRVGLGPEPRSNWVPTPEAFGAARVRSVAVDDWVRADEVLSVEIPRVEDATVGFAMLRSLSWSNPGEPTWRADVWARAWPADDGGAAPRLGLSADGRVQWVQPSAEWRQFTFEVPPRQDLLLLAEGAGVLQVAELDWAPGRQP